MPDVTATTGNTCSDCACRPQCLLGRVDASFPTAWRAHLSERRFRKGELLQRQGERMHCVRVIKIGALLVQRRSDDGVNRSVGMAGCCASLATPAVLQQPAGLSYVALTPGRVCELPLTALKELGPAMDSFALELAREQLLEAERLADWGRIARIRGVVGQMAGALVQLADLQRSTLVRLPSHTVLAALLATTRESVARALAHLAHEGGLLRRDRWHCEIRREALLELACGGRRSAASLQRTRRGTGPADTAGATHHAAASPAIALQPRSSAARSVRHLNVPTPVQTGRLQES